MLDNDWHLNETRTDDLRFCFENDEDDVVFVPKSFTENENTARAIASEIFYNRKNWFERGIDAGRASMASDLRALLDVRQASEE